MKKKVSISTTITLMAITASITVAITSVLSLQTFNGKVANVNESKAMYSKISEVEGIVRQYCLFELNENSIQEFVTIGLLQGINDTYAGYFTPENYTLQQQVLEGRIVGIGISVVKDDSGFPIIVDIYDESPASDVELKTDDLIVKVNETDATISNYDEIINMITGEVGTKVSLTIRRENEELTFELTRRKYVIPTLSYTALNNNTGYINITNITDFTADEFSKATADLINQGVNGLLFDLRNNPGGTLTGITKILDSLLPEGDIVSQTTKDGITTVLERSDPDHIDLPMVVIVNEKTASAAELFAQALKDYDKATIVGVNTFGKGVMQSLYKLNDGSAINITTAYFNPPRSKNFDKIGIKPDYEIKLPTELEKDPSLINYYNDTQYNKGCEILEALKKQRDPAYSTPPGADNLPKTPPDIITPDLQDSDSDLQDSDSDLQDSD